MKKLSKNSFFKIWLPVALLFGLFGYALLSFTSQFIKPMPEKRLSIATGREGEGYYQIALEYKKLLEQENVEVNIIPTAGSMEAYKLIEQKKADIAFHQGGLIGEHNISKVASLATIYYEPIWLFYQKELGVEYLKELKGKRVSIGEEGSGTKIVASKLFATSFIDSNNTTLLNLSNEEAAHALQNKTIDAFLIVTSAKTEIIQKMLQDPNISLLSFKRAKAYDRHFNFLSDLKLYEGSICLSKNLPNQDMTLLSTTASLIVDRELEEELIRIFMKQVKKVHSKESILEDAKEFPSQENLELPIHPEAKRYLEHGDTWLEKIFPFWIANNIDRLKILIIPLLTLLIPLIKGFMPIYRWSIRFKIYRWYDDINAVDLQLDNLSDKEKLEKLYKQTLLLSQEINETTKVPLSYMGEYYNLRMHIALIIDKIERMKKASRVF